GVDAGVRPQAPPRIVRGPGLHLGRRRIGAAVVDDDQLVGDALPAQALAQGVERGADVGSFVARRDDDGELHSGPARRPQAGLQGEKTRGAPRRRCSPAGDWGRSAAYMRVLVTGGAGFIGSFVVDRLLAAGHAVRVLDNLDPQVHPHGPPDYLAPEADLVRGDVRDRGLLERTV